MSDDTSKPQEKIQAEGETNKENKLVYAGFWRRFGSFWIDVIVMSPLTILSLWLSQNYRLFYIYNFIPLIIIKIFYEVWLVKRYGGTLGKLILKTRITRLDGSPVGYSEPIIRFFVSFTLINLASIAVIIASLGMTDSEYLSMSYIERNNRILQLAPVWYQPTVILLNIWTWSEFIVILTNKKRRALLDFMAGTVVVRSN